MTVRGTIEAAIEVADAMGMANHERIGFIFGAVIKEHCAGDVNLWFRVVGIDRETLLQMVENDRDELAAERFKRWFGKTALEVLRETRPPLKVVE